MTRGKVHTYFVYHEEGSHYQRADSLEEEGDAYVFRLGGEVVLHLEKRSVKTLRLLSDKEADEIASVDA